MKFKMIRLAAMATLLLAAWPAAAAEMKVGAVDIKRLFEGAPQVKTLEQGLQNEFGAQQRELTNMQKELRSLEEKLNRDGAVMAERERADTERRGRELQRDLQRRVAELQQDFNDRRNEELGKLQRIIVREVNEFAKAERYDLILSDGVLYATPALDVTTQVLKRLESAASAPAAGGKK